MGKAIGFAAALLVCLLLLYCLMPSSPPIVVDSTAAPNPAATNEATAGNEANIFLRADFDPEVLAKAETQMWQAYYSKNLLQLNASLNQALIEQFDVPPDKAQAIAVDLASAAMRFQSASGNYESVALEPLVSAYTKIHELTGGSWNPNEVARAELAWWVARRTPGGNSRENIGRLIAEEYALLYGHTNANIQRAGQYRAEAARIRDELQDWKQVENLLIGSYTALQSGITQAK